MILGLVLEYDVNVVLEYESHLGGKARELDWLVLWKVHYIVGGAGSGPGKELDIPIVGGAGSGPGKELDKKLDIPLVGGHILIRYSRVRRNDGLDCPDTLLCEQ